MKDIIRNIVKDTQRKEQHAAHTEIIKEVFDDLERLYHTLDIETGDGIKYRLQRSQLRYMLEALSKMQASVITLLSSKLYAGVDPLARVVMEHAVNVMYIAESKENERPKQLIKHYIEKTAENSRHWLESAKASDDEIAIELAQKKVDHFVKLKQDHLGVYERSIGKWPNPFKRFEALGLVNEYATLYSMNSDSVHSLSEDIFNFCTLESYPEELKHYAFRNFQALNLSMSVYLGMKSVLFYALALDKVLTLLGRDDDVFQILAKLNHAALEHEDENFARWS